MAFGEAQARPIIGHEEVLALLQENPAQTLLFTGPEGVGRRRVAQWLAEREGGGYLELSPEGKGRPEIGLEKVEALLDWLSTAPARGRKIGVVDGAHRLTEAAANALLKPLEEPPSYARLILIAPSREALLPTLASRALEIPFRPVPEEALTPFTQDPLLLAYANGAPGRLFRALERADGIRALHRLAQGVKAQSGLERLSALRALFQKVEEEGLPLEEGVFLLRIALGPHPALGEALKAIEGYVSRDLLLAWLSLKLAP
ncbi:MAG: DNA polymerase III subunit delta' [Thermaceae bacterium]